MKECEVKIGRIRGTGGKKWKLTLILITIFTLIAIGFLIRDWNDVGLWIGLFGAFSSASVIFTEGNHRDKKAHIQSEVDMEKIKSEAAGR